MYAPITSGCGALEWRLGDAPSITWAHFVLRCFIQDLIPLCGFSYVHWISIFPLHYCVVSWFSIFFFVIWDVNVCMYSMLMKGVFVSLSVNVYACAYIFKWQWESDTMLIQWNGVFIAVLWLSRVALMVLFLSACFIMRFLHRRNVNKSVQRYSFISFMCTRQDRIIITAT